MLLTSRVKDAHVHICVDAQAGTWYRDTWCRQQQQWPCQNCFTSCRKTETSRVLHHGTLVDRHQHFQQRRRQKRHHLHVQLQRMPRTTTDRPHLTVVCLLDIRLVGHLVGSLGTDRHHKGKTWETTGEKTRQETDRFFTAVTKRPRLGTSRWWRPVDQCTSTRVSASTSAPEESRTTPEMQGVIEALFWLNTCVDRGTDSPR